MLFLNAFYLLQVGGRGAERPISESEEEFDESPSKITKRDKEENLSCNSSDVSDENSLSQEDSIQLPNFHRWVIFINAHSYIL